MAWSWRRCSPAPVCWPGGRSPTAANRPPAASASPALYEATQQSLNKAKFDATLMPIAEPWLDGVGGCAINTEKSGPGLAAGEKQHVFCRYLGVSLHFAEYESAEKKEAARAFRQQMGIIGRALAPACGRPVRPPAASAGRRAATSSTPATAGTAARSAASGGAATTTPARSTWRRPAAPASAATGTRCATLWQRHG
ncbi:hypothetical protein V2I01_21335 [Micromonospora sp. BRA006-A]|nr:hypothetical protein [Micromonospora sp. BRA006-A]